MCSTSSPTFATMRPFFAAKGRRHGFGVVSQLDEISDGIHRSSSKTLTALRCSALRSGASITVGRRPSAPERTRTSVAFTSESIFIKGRTGFRASNAKRAKLTSIKPITVANVWSRKEPSARWCEGPQGTTPPFLARRNSSSTFHWPRKACTMRPVLHRW